MSLTKQPLLEKKDEMLLEVTRAVASVQLSGYGSVEVTIHEGRITLIEKREKFRVTQEKSEKRKRDASTILHD